MSNTNPAPQTQQQQTTERQVVAPVNQPVLDHTHPQFWQYNRQLANKG